MFSPVPVKTSRSILLVLPFISTAFALPLAFQNSYDEHLSTSPHLTALAHAAISRTPAHDERLNAWDAEIGWMLQVLSLIAVASLIMVSLNLCMKLYTSRRTSGHVRLEGDELLVVTAQETTPSAEVVPCSLSAESV
ncbi:hypothetical protein VTO73DRAFT_2319 [Trametes versicolor]